MQGPGEVHLSGYYEHQGEGMDEGMYMDDEIDVEGSEDSDEVNSHIR